MPELTHINKYGEANMVNTAKKESTERFAKAQAVVLMRSETLTAITCNNIKKGDVLPTARIAGIMAAKNTSALIPLCHPIPVDSIALSFTLSPPDKIIIEASVTSVYKTGVEMEALTAASVAALTIYDMCKAIDKAMVISEVKLIKKTGGKSGDYSLNGQ